MPKSKKKLYLITYSVYVEGHDCGTGKNEVIALNKKSAEKKSHRLLSHTASIIAIKNDIAKKNVKVLLEDID